MGAVILAVNCGSSSLKYAAFGDAEVRGSIALGDGVSDHVAAVGAMFARGIPRPHAVGHRLVHGGPDHREPARVDDALLAALDEAVAFAPLHLPAELSAIRAVGARFGDVPQVACFDTGFHATLPEVAWRVPLPVADSLRRYGFHGLSYEYVAGVVGAARVPRAIFAHLGGGASMVALRHGRAIDTTMGMTPAGGLVMGTRPGDLDPGLVLFLLDRGHRDLVTMIHRDGGLFALGGTSSMRELLARRADDPRAALAVDVFCYQARKWVGSYAAALGGVDLLVFTGGIGEHAPAVRAQICDGLGFLGIAIDAARNAANAPAIGAGACDVRVVATDEEAVIARHTRRLLGLR